MENLKQYFLSPTRTRTLSVVALLFLIAAVPVTVFLAGQQQELRQQAQMAPQNLRVFVTSTTYNGALGGTAGADAKCQAQATAANLSGTWKAWISALGENAKDRINNGAYVRMDGRTIATSLTDLTDGTIQTPINRDERNTAVNRADVWTGTRKSGVADPNTCSGWTVSTSRDRARAGTTVQSSDNWTDFQNLTCEKTARLYCFEQPPVNPTTVPPTPTSGGPTITPPTPTPTNTPSCNGINRSPGCACTSDNQCVARVCERNVGVRTGPKICQGTPEYCNVATNKPGGCRCKNNNQCQTETGRRCVNPSGPGSEKFCEGQAPTSTPTPTGVPPTPTPTTAQSSSNLTITLKLQGVQGNDRGRNKHIKVQLKQGTTVAFTDNNVSLTKNNTNDVFTATINNVPTGTYDIFIKVPGRLQIKDSVTIANGENAKDFTARRFSAGDFNNDNILNIGDIGLILSKYTILNVPVTSENEQFDVDENNQINITDVSIVLSNYTALTVAGE